MRRSLRTNAQVEAGMIRSETAAQILAGGIGLEMDLSRIALGLVGGWSPQYNRWDAAEVGHVHHQVIGGDHSIEELHD